MSDHPKYATVGEAAERFHVDPRTIRRLIQSGALPSIRVGPCSTRIPAEALDALADQKAAA